MVVVNNEVEDAYYKSIIFRLKNRGEVSGRKMEDKPKVLNFI